MLVASMVLAAPVNHDHAAIEKIVNKIAKGQLVIKRYIPAPDNLQGVVVEPKAGGRVLCFMLISKDVNYFLVICWMLMGKILPKPIPKNILQLPRPKRRTWRQLGPIGLNKVVLKRRINFMLRLTLTVVTAI